MNMRNLAAWAARRYRLFIFAAVVLLHAIALFSVNFSQAKKAAGDVSNPARVMKLVDIREKEKEKPEPMLPIEEPKETLPAQEAVAESLIETKEDLPTNPEEPDPQNQLRLPAGSTEINVFNDADYLPQFKISVVPKISEDDIRRSLKYPETARKAGIEGVVYLELFVDFRGSIRKITILKEDPAGFGLAEAALKAFADVSCVPAYANGKAVSARYRYPIRFSLK